MEWVSFPKIGIGKIFLRDYAFLLFGLEIKWYAIIICFAIICGCFTAIFFSKKFGAKKENIIDVTVFGMIFAIIGVRLFYVVFNFEMFYGNLWQIFNLRTGGLAIYGGIISSVLSCFFYCRVKKIKFLPIVDLSGIGFLVGQTIGRWGNFINIEAYGTKTDLPWGMTSSKIPQELQPVHPTFFYESLWCFLGLLLIIFLMRYRKFDGQVFLFYISWYGFGRFFIEGLRSDSLWLIKDKVKVSQALSLVLFFLAVIWHIYFLFFYMKKHKDKEFLYVNYLNKKTK